ncbi:MAG: hypothetical protein E7065_05655 [Lentimicrobiaceae bacterium]|nr:hypothetical protein [Lentimicrobiaceae bacterium]
MRMFLLYILLALLGQQTTFLETENLKTSESEKSCEQRAMSHEQKSPNVQGSQHEAQSPSQVFSFSVSQILYFENQIRLADSLYKNYLPQYNFEEVKAAVMFFDSCEPRAMSYEPFLESENLKTSDSEKGCEPRAMSNEQRSQNTQSSQLEAQSLKKTVDCCPLTVDIEYQRARAHYYHAVGLTERDDIVGACEHYLCALEIMEAETENLKTSESGKGSEQRAMSHEQKFRNAHSSKLEVQSPDYEKIRFVALIHIRIGELFYDENCFDIALMQYNISLKYANALGDNELAGNILKYIGSSYHISGNTDKALIYYYESLKTNTNKNNYTDIQKSIAKILYGRGDKDSAYYILKDNIRKTDTKCVYEAYCFTLGEMFYKDKVYYSAENYLKRSFKSDDENIRFASSKSLYALYDSVNDISNKNYYGNIYFKFSNDEINNSIEKDTLQKVYNDYLLRKHKGRHEVRLKRMYASVFIPITAIAIVISTYLIIRYRRKSKNLNTQLADKENEIEEKKSVINDLRFRQSIIEGKIKSKNEELKRKDEIIKSQNLELSSIKDKIHDIDSPIDLNAFYASDICKRILLQNKNRILPLCDNDITLLLTSADIHLNNFTVRICQSFPNLKKGDLVYLCLILLRQDNYKITLLLSKNRKTVWERMKKIKERMCIEEDTDIRDIISAFLQ